MATFKKFEEIEAWKKSRELTRKVYGTSNQSPFARDFGLRDQIRSAALSIMSNIAEGHDRSGTAEFIQFLAIAKGSAAEIQSQLFVALDQEHIDQQAFEQLKALANETGRMIGGLIAYLRKTQYRGTKYKKSFEQT